MLRSFEYAGHHRVVETQASPQLNYRASEWAERNRDAFCAGYAEAIGADPREQAIVLRAFEADKAVYEAVYEARNRPTWLPIPLRHLDPARRRCAMKTGINAPPRFAGHHDRKTVAR